jgi:hypothetical protein
MSSAETTSGREAGQFQRGLGSKAGGFIAKKFFHPTSHRNMERLWIAERKKAEQEKVQEQMRAKREDEHRVEELRRTLYQSTGKVDDSGPVRRDEDKSKEEIALEKETRRRKHALQQEQRYTAQQQQGAGGLSFPNQASGLSFPGRSPASPADEEEPAAKSAKATPAEPVLRRDTEVVDVESVGLSSSAAAQVKAAEEKAKPALRLSKYKEDVHTNGHTSVWGSWWSKEQKTWGYSCCQQVDKAAACSNPKKD